MVSHLVIELNLKFRTSTLFIAKEQKKKNNKCEF